MGLGRQTVGVGAAVVAAVAAVLVGGASAATGAPTLIVRGTAYGSVLFSSGGQPVYTYAPDRTPKSTCYGTCAMFWHPVLTNGKAVAGAGVKASLLGTTTRKDGTRQVTYNRHPLYFDNMPGETHRGGEIGCQHLKVNGGIWLIMKPNGQPNRSLSKSHE